MLHEKVTELGEKILKINGLNVSFDDQNQVMDTSDQDAFQEQLKHAQESISFYFDIKLSELLSEDLLENVLSKVEQLRDFVNELRLYASLQEKEKYNRMKEEEKQEELPET